MELDQAILELQELETDKIKKIQFNLDHNIFYTLELKPDFHDTMLKACEILLNERA